MIVKNDKCCGYLFILYGPSGSGKTTICNKLIEKLGKKHLFERLISYTTRPARTGEVDGVDYHFTVPHLFWCMEQDDKFLETTRYDHYAYGTPRSALDKLAAGISLISVTDRAGAQRLKTLIPCSVSLFIGVSDQQILKDRLTIRAKAISQSPQHLAQRITLACDELLYEQQHPLADVVIMNDDLDQAIRQALAVVASYVGFGEAL